MNSTFSRPVHLPTDQLGSSFRRSVFNNDILAFNVAKLAHTLTEFLNKARVNSGPGSIKAYLSPPLLAVARRLDKKKRESTQTPLKQGDFSSC